MLLNELLLRNIISLCLVKYGTTDQSLSLQRYFDNPIYININGAWFAHTSLISLAWASLAQPNPLYYIANALRAGIRAPSAGEYGDVKILQFLRVVE